MRSNRFCSLNRLRPLLLLAPLGLIFAAPTVARAQLPQARLYSVSPPGGQAGATLDVKLSSGTDLDEVNRLWFNHPGITAAQKMQESGGQQQPIENTFVVTIDPDVPPGLYEVRAAGYYGLTNPRTFVVGSQAEIQETEPNNSPEQATPVELNTVVNAAAGGGTDVDYFKFTGQQGQRLIITCRAARIDSRMNATIELFDAAGRRLAHSRNDVRQDPLIDFTPEANGEYIARVYDFTYRGGADYFYRFAVSSAPHIDYIMPPAAPAGTTQSFTLFGRNLPGGEPAGVSIEGHELQKLDVEIALPESVAVLDAGENPNPVEAGQDGISYSLSTPEGDSNAVFIFFASGPAVVETEPNDTAEQAQTIAVPGEYAGQFQSPGDVDVVEFEAAAGDVYFIEVFGERNNLSRTDPFLIVEQVSVDGDGKETVKRLTAQDDTGTNLAPIAFDTVTDDPVFRLQAPASSKYRVTLRDRYFESRGSPRLIYRLAVRKEQPDFRLVAQPTAPQAPGTQAAGTWAIGLRKGDNFGVEVLAFRRDGFDGTIDVTAEELPQGVVCKGAAIGPGQTSATLVFTASEDAPDWSGTIRVVGKARLEDPEQVKAVQTAQQAVQAKSEAAAKLAEPASAAAQAVKTAEEKLNAALTAARNSAGDEKLQQALIGAVKTTAVTDAKLKEANDARAAADQAVADARAALQAAEAARQAAIREVTRDARPATVVWNGDQNTPAISRVGRSLGLSVHSEQAPYQVTTDVFRVNANQSRQILVPVALHKRNGFDADVALTFVGFPKNSKIQIENKPVKKGSDSEVLRLFVPNDAPPGTYTAYLSTQGQVSYRRNLPKLERTKAEHAEIAKTAEAAAAAAKQAADGLAAATQKLAADEEAVKQSQTLLAEATKQTEAAAAALKSADENKTKADQLAKNTAEAAALAADAAARAKQAAEQSTADQAVAESLAASAKALADAAALAAAAQKKAADVQTSAEKSLADSQAAADAAQTGLVEAKKKLAESQAALEAAQKAKAAADAASKQAEEKSKAAAEKKAAADKTLEAAEKAAAAQNVNVFPPSTPLVIEVKPAPLTLAAAVPDSGNIKQGAKIDVKVTVNRTNGFAGPVTLTLPLPPGVAGLTAEPVTIPADQTEGVLAITAAADATEGKLPNMVVRATTDFQGSQAVVDVPVTLTVAKP